LLAEARNWSAGANTISVLVDGVARIFSGASALVPGSGASFTQHTSHAGLNCTRHRRVPEAKRAHLLRGLFNVGGMHNCDFRKRAAAGAIA
jgi:hypothetical protein